MEYLSSMTHFVYYAAGLLFCLGLLAIITSPSLIKKLFGLALFQVSIMLFFVSLGKVKGAVAPVIDEANPEAIYSNPLPQVLMLTAIVVGLACLSVGLALAIRIKKEFGRADEDAIDG